MQVPSLTLDTMLGQHSEFLDKRIASQHDLDKHTEAAAQYVQAQREQADADKPASANNKQAVKEASRVWHDAVKLRRESIAISKQYLDAEITRLRTRHLEYVASFDEGVDSARATLKSLRGY